MKTIGRFELIALSLVLAAARPAFAFSNSSLSGAYAFQVSGEALFGPADGSAARPIHIAAAGILRFDGAGHLAGTDTTSGTETFAAGRSAGGPYSSQVVCEMQMAGTYRVRHDGSLRMTITFTPAAEESSCGSSTGTFIGVMANSSLAYYESTAQSMAEPGQGEFFAYVVSGELRRQHGGEE